MSYRDDRDADQARITALEADLEAARRKIDDLEGRRSEALVLATSSALANRPDKKIPWFGATRLELTATFEGEFPRDDMETLVEELRALTRDHGRSELFKSSMTWSSSTDQRSMGPFLMITVVIKDGQTTLRATDQLKALAGGIYGGIGGGVGGGGIVLPVFAALALPVMIPVIVGAWVGGVLLGARAIYKRASRKRAERLQVVFDAVSALIKAKIAATRPA
jgi:hypothetical protein